MTSQKRARSGPKALALSSPDSPTYAHTFLYVGATRWDSSGSTTLGVWFVKAQLGTVGGKFCTLDSDGDPILNSPAHHEPGDLLLVANFGSGTPSLIYFTWTDQNRLSAPTTLTTGDPSNIAAVNSQPIDVPWPYMSSAGLANGKVPANQFLEVGVDLNLLFGKDAGNL